MCVNLLCVDEQLNDFDGWMLILNELRYELVCEAMMIGVVKQSQIGRASCRERV